MSLGVPLRKRMGIVAVLVIGMLSVNLEYPRIIHFYGISEY